MWGYLITVNNFWLLMPQTMLIWCTYWFELWRKHFSDRVTSSFVILKNAANILFEDAQLDKFGSLTSELGKPSFQHSVFSFPQGSIRAVLNSTTVTVHCVHLSSCETYSTIYFESEANIHTFIFYDWVVFLYWKQHLSLLRLWNHLKVSEIKMLTCVCVTCNKKFHHLCRHFVCLLPMHFTPYRCSPVFSRVF